MSGQEVGGQVGYKWLRLEVRDEHLRGRAAFSKAAEIWVRVVGSVFNGVAVEARIFRL